MAIQFQNNSAQVKEVVKLAAQRALEASGLFLEGAVKMNAPEGETKQLKNSITHQVAK